MNCILYILEKHFEITKSIHDWAIEKEQYASAQCAIDGLENLQEEIRVLSSNLDSKENKHEFESLRFLIKRFIRENKTTKTKQERN